METQSENKNIHDNMVIKIVNGHMFSVDMLKNTYTYTLKPATCRFKSAHQPSYPPLGTLGFYKNQEKCLVSPGKGSELWLISLASR